MLKKHAGALAALAILISGHSGAAQTADRNPLAKIKRVKCTFPVNSTGSWKNGEPQAQVKQTQEFSIEIDEIDPEGATARVVGTSGAAHVTAFLTLSSLHIMERTMSGTLNLTTIFAPEGDSRKLRAVHSRHAYLQMSIPGLVSEPTVSQSYGVCDPGQ